MNESETTSEKPDVPESAEQVTPEAAASPGAVPEAVGAEAQEAPASDETASELEKIQRERDENYQRYLRAMADLENYRRRVAREKDELRQYGIADLVESLLPVYENLKLAIASAQQATDAEVIAKGVSLVFDQFRSALASKGVVEINPAVGAEFDPHQHESLAHAPSDTVPEEKIVQVVRTGFALNERILRPASVILSKGPAREEASAVP
jgi:molecular chaperone GrpE